MVGSPESYAPHGNSGGLVHITADSLVLDGAIYANGYDGRADSNISFGGGAGGGIRIEVGTLSGSGRISANGGHGPDSSSGGGSGGRIAVYYADKSGFTGSVSAFGGSGYVSGSQGKIGYGGAGTVYLKSSAQEYGDLLIDNAGRITTDYSTPLWAIGAGVSDSVVYSPASGRSILTKAGAGWPVPNFATGVPGLKGLWLNPNTVQADTPLFSVIDNTAESIIVAGDMTQVAAGGDPFIGEYIFGSLEVRGQARLSTLDDIYIHSKLQVYGAYLKAQDLVVTETTRLQFTNGALDTKEPLFDELPAVMLTNCTLTAPPGKSLEIVTGDLIIDSNSSIDVSGKGYKVGYTLGNVNYSNGRGGTGGSYGGRGGKSNLDREPNNPYGDYSDPAYFGTGGGYILIVGSLENYAPYGDAGGHIHILADNLVLNGSLLANGNGGYSTLNGAVGGGSGGSIRVDTGRLSGSGKISACGGSDNIKNVGGGSGGRVALYYADKSGFTGSISAYGGVGYGLSYFGYGGAGTIYQKSTAQRYGDLTIDNANRQTYGYSTPLRAIGSGVSDTMAYSPAANRSIMTCAAAAWPVPGGVAGDVGLKRLMLNPNIGQSNPVLFAVVDNTANTLIVSGDITQTAQSGDSFIGEYHLDQLRVINNAQVSTTDDVYFALIDTSGGSLNAHNISLSGMSEPGLRLVLDFGKSGAVFQNMLAGFDAGLDEPVFSKRFQVMLVRGIKLPDIALSR